jgi:hypothetical protein
MIKSLAVQRVMMKMDAGVVSLINREMFKPNLSRFEGHLWMAIETADKDNLQLLRKAYPLHVAAWDHYKYTPGWWDGVRNKILVATDLKIVDPN